MSESSCNKNNDEDDEDEFDDENKENQCGSFQSVNLASSLSKKLHLNKLKSTAAEADNNNNSQRQIGIDDFDLIKVIGSGSYAKV